MVSTGALSSEVAACSLARERYRPLGMGSLEEAHPHPSDPIRISKLTVQDSECPLGSRVPGCVEHHQARRACLPGSWLEPLLHRGRLQSEPRCSGETPQTHQRPAGTPWDPPARSFTGKYPPATQGSPHQPSIKRKGKKERAYHTQTSPCHTHPHQGKAGPLDPHLEP